MSLSKKMENAHLISSLSKKSKSVPSLLLLSEPNNNIKNNINNNINKEYDRLKIIDDEINNKNTELIKIENKLNKIKNKEFLIKKEKYELNELSLPYNKKQEILENNKIIKKLNLQNISINNKIKKISDKADKIEFELVHKRKIERIFGTKRCIKIKNRRK